MERKTKGKLDCKELDKGLRMNEHTLDALITPGHYKIESCDVTSSEGFPEEISKGRLSAYLEVTSTNHSSDRLKDNAIGQVLTVTDSNGLTNIYTRNRTNSNGAYIWSEWSGVGGKSAGDIMDGAITAQKLSSDIRTNVVSPLRPLFIAAGAEYNDTDKVQIKKLKFDMSEIVEHMPNCYCLNGLGDISEEEMLKIYNTGYFYGGVYGALSGLENRTNLGRLSSANFDQDTPKLAYASQCTTISLCIPTLGYESSFYIKSDNYFSLATNIRAIYGKLVLGGYYVNTFKSCQALERVKIYNIRVNVSLKDSPLLSKNSSVYMIQNAIPTTAITITLHPDAYSRLKDDADIIAALESQPLISLVCA